MVNAAVHFIAGMLNQSVEDMTENHSSRCAEGERLLILVLYSGPGTIGNLTNPCDSSALSTESHWNEETRSPNNELGYRDNQRIAIAAEPCDYPCLSSTSKSARFLFSQNRDSNEAGESERPDLSSPRAKIFTGESSVTENDGTPPSQNQYSLALISIGPRANPNVEETICEGVVNTHSDSPGVIGIPTQNDSSDTSSAS
jgi:hypothetical protein